MNVSVILFAGTPPAGVHADGEYLHIPTAMGTTVSVVCCRHQLLNGLCSCNIRAAADRNIRLASVDGDADRLVYHYFDSEVLRCIRMMWPLSAMLIASEWVQWTATFVYFISPGPLAPAGW